MKIKVLGCSGGQLPGHYPAGFLLDGRVMIDAGTIGLKLPISEQRKIRAAVISHAHLDHVGALPLFAVNITSNTSGPVSVYAADETLKALSAHLMNWVIWPDFTKIYNYGGKPVFKYVRLAKKGWQKVEGYRVKAVPVHHSIPAYGFIIGKGSSYFVYTGDTKQTDELWAEASKLGKKLKSVMIEVAYPDSQRELAERSAHLVPQTLARELAKLGGLKPKVFVMHMKPEFVGMIKSELKKLKGLEVTAMEEGKTYNL
jgi:cAMP phosphodiesterase